MSTHNTREVEESRKKFGRFYTQINPPVQENEWGEKEAFGSDDIENFWIDVLHQELQKAYERGVQDELNRESQNMDAVIAGMLQKARAEERKTIKLRIDYDRRKSIPAEETVNDIYDSIELKNQSELDQPTPTN